MCPIKDIVVDLPQVVFERDVDERGGGKTTDELKVGQNHRARLESDESMVK